MLGVDRRREALEYLRQRRSARVSELADVLAVSVQTVRRDLAELEHDGLVARVHGGVVLSDAAADEPAAVERLGRNRELKRRIGAAAARLVPDGSTVFVSGGTTTEAAVPFLAAVRGLTVITNALNVAYALARHPSVEVIVLSGYLRHSEMTLLGHLAEQAVGELVIDVAVYGCFGIDPEEGLSGASLPEASMDRRVLGAAGRVVVLADHTKFVQRGSVRLAGVEQVDALVTDAEAPAAALERLRERGVEVVVA